MRKYELMFIVRPDLPEEELARLVTEMEGVATGSGGKIEKVDRMGRRRLAYRVHRYREGQYVLFTVEGGGDMVREFERHLKMKEVVIKHLSVRVDEELKRAEKMKAWRAQQAARKPRPRPSGGEAPGAQASQA